MALISLSTSGTTPFERLMGHVPEVQEQWEKLELAFLKQQTFDPDFLEQVRRALAFNNQCQYCMAKAGPPDENPKDARLITALRFANKFTISHLSLDEDEMAHLKKYFSEAEMVELIAFCSFISASQRFGAVLGLKSSESYA